MIYAKKGSILVDSLIMMMIVMMILTLCMNTLYVMNHMEAKHYDEQLQETRVYLD